MKTKAFFIPLAVAFFVSTPIGNLLSQEHPPINLRDEHGNVIDPVHGKNADQPYSPKQTCGKCHDYATITKGYHFQQGWDEMKDFKKKKDKPWVLSPGMMGKW